MWDTANDISTVGETRRGREGESRGVNLVVKVVCVRDRSLGLVVEGLLGFLFWGEGGPSDNRERAAVHASRSLSEATLG